MKKTVKVLILITLGLIALFIGEKKVEAAQYIWPIGGDNAKETYVDYEYYGKYNEQPVKNGKSGREYIVDNQKWPNELYYYASCESHYGMDITGVNGHRYKVVSVVDGVVLCTSANAANYPSVNYQDRNQRRTPAGLADGSGYGNYVIIQEISTGRCFLYGHLKGGTIKVSKGDRVSVGQEIATMGSSGDAGHMHLHFEIRKSKDVTILETRYGYHYIYTTNSNTNLDPKDYIGSSPDVRRPVTDQKIVKVSEDEIRIYIKYLYNAVLDRNPTTEEVGNLVNVYLNTESIYEVTQKVFMSTEATEKMQGISDLDFIKQIYEILLYRGKKYTEREMAGHLKNLTDGYWNRNDFIAMICNCSEFNSKIDDITIDEKIRQQIGIALPSKLKTPGDLNADGTINSVDASICLRLYTRSDLYSKINYVLPYADIDGDGYISSVDACWILKYYARLSVGKFLMKDISLKEYVNSGIK